MAFGIDDIIGEGLKLINKWVPDPAEQAKAASEWRNSVLSAAGKSDEQQGAANAAEASSGSVFVAGWRPFIGWVCGLALAFQFMVTPITLWVADLLGHDLPAPPALDDVLWQLLFGMLGLGSLRTLEKMKGVAR